MDRGAIFLDRDGTVIEEVGYLSKIEDIQLLPGAAEGIRRFNEAGWPVIVITNQSGVARGYFPESFVHEVHSTISSMLARYGAKIDAWYYCPHHPDGVVDGYVFKCPSRKPATGMIDTACREHGISASSSVVAGDSLKDIELAIAVGARPVLVTTGYGRQTFETMPDSVRKDLFAKVERLDDLAVLVCGS